MIAETGASSKKDMVRVMKETMARLKGQADDMRSFAGPPVDLVIVDDSLTPRMTIVGGEVVRS